ncbi:MAG: hypothetical protein AB8B91_23615 [Rubripirellula sp.]
MDPASKNRRTTPHLLPTMQPHQHAPSLSSLEDLGGVLGAMESEAMQKLIANQNDLDSAITPLVELALYRYARSSPKTLKSSSFANDCWLMWASMERWCWQP